MRRLVRASAFALLCLLPAAAAAEPIAATDGEMPGLKIEVQELKLVSGTVHTG